MLRFRKGSIPFPPGLIRSLTLLLPLLLALLLLLGACAGRRPAPTGTRAELALLATTDLHAWVLSYDYLRQAEDPTVGLERTATLVRRAQREFPDHLLLDNGDTIQGSELGHYQALAGPGAPDGTLAVHRVMNYLGYAAGTVGNHDLDYGLEYLARAAGIRFPGCPAPFGGPAFPLLSANLVAAGTDRPVFQPWVLVDRPVRGVTPDGRTVRASVKVGLVAFTPPQVLAWNRHLLEGKVDARGMVESARDWIPELRRLGAEVVVAMVHGGVDGGPYHGAMNDAGYHLARLPGIDAMLLGHTHRTFPDPDTRAAEFRLPGVDPAKGTVHGVPAVMAGSRGEALGIIRLGLVHDGRRWRAQPGAAAVEVRPVRGVPPDPAVAALVEAEHQGTLAYLRAPLGRADFPMTTFFASVGEVSALQVVNDAQRAHAASRLGAGLARYAHLPLLSVAAPALEGYAGPSDYTRIDPGPVTMRHAAGLCPYPNLLSLVKVNGAELRAWLEWSARRFNRIDPARTGSQELINPAFPSYCFDSFTTPELRYEIDVTRPAGSRIRRLTFRGAPMDPRREFLVATSSFRADGGGGCPVLDGSRTVYTFRETCRDLVAAHLAAAGRLTREAHGSARSWRFSPVATRGKLLFRAPRGELALAQGAGLTGVSVFRDDDGSGRGFAVYAIDLAKAHAGTAGPGRLQPVPRGR
jgi:2',3'-cyclic-nucleotide 2'-phosphodiesterase/3'-nucleotidase